MAAMAPALRLGAHHLLCLPRFQERGFNPEFCLREGVGEENLVYADQTRRQVEVTFPASVMEWVCQGRNWQTHCL